jgi:hypothetical protein
MAHSETDSNCMAFDPRAQLSEQHVFLVLLQAIPERTYAAVQWALMSSGPIGTGMHSIDFRCDGIPEQSVVASKDGISSLSLPFLR